MAPARPPDVERRAVRLARMAPAGRARHTRGLRREREGREAAQEHTPTHVVPLSHRQECVGAVLEPSSMGGGGGGGGSSALLREDGQL